MLKDLNKQINDYVRQLKGTRAAKRAQKIEMRNKILLSNLSKVESKQRGFSSKVEQEGERLHGGPGLEGKVARSMAEALEQDHKIAAQPASGGATVRTEAETLVKYAQKSGEFAQDSVAAVVDHDKCIRCKAIRIRI